MEQGLDLLPVITQDELDRISDKFSVPWGRSTWHGQLVSTDGTPTVDFSAGDVHLVVSIGPAERSDWEGYDVGVALLKDGRFVSRESSRGPTGSGFSEDAYGGDADIAFSSTYDAAVRHISEAGREDLVQYDDHQIQLLLGSRAATTLRAGK